MRTSICFFCGEKITKKAIKCPHCQEWLTLGWIKSPVVSIQVWGGLIGVIVTISGWIYGGYQLYEKNKALDFKPLFEDAFKKASSGDIDSAIPEYQKALQIEPKNSDALQLLGYAEYVKWSKTKSSNELLIKALKDLKNAVDTEPNNLWAHYNYSIVLWSANKQIDAVNQIKTLLVLAPSFKEKIQADGQFEPFKTSSEFMYLIWN